MSRQLVLLVVALLVAGCSYLESPSSTTEPATSTTGDGAVATTSPTETTLAGDSPCLSGDRPFVDDGLVSAFGGADGDASHISSIRWFDYSGCEQVIVDLLTADGAPAGSLDPVGVEYDATAGLIRVSLPPAINRSAVADSLIDADLVARAFVVLTPEGRLALDVHLAAGRGYAVRAYEVDSPSRIVIDIQEEAEVSPVLGTRVGNSVVIVSPQAGPVGRSFVLTGYVKGSYDTVLASLLPTDGTDEPLASQQTDIAGDQSLWVEFTMTFRDVPELALTLIVAPDGQEQYAATLPLDASTPAAADAPEL